jgi:hypothetical protein
MRTVGEMTETSYGIVPSVVERCHALNKYRRSLHPGDHFIECATISQMTVW